MLFGNQIKDHTASAEYLLQCKQILHIVSSISTDFITNSRPLNFSLL